MKEGVKKDGPESRVNRVMFYSKFMPIFNIGGLVYGLIVYCCDMAGIFCYGLLEPIIDMALYVMI